MKFTVEAPEQVNEAEQRLRDAGKLNGHAGGNGTAPPLLISATELYRGQVVRLKPVFENLLFDGLTMLVARPKAGKSWLTLQAAIHIAGGRALPGVTVLENGPVLYGAFEEPAARTMARLRQIAEPGEWARRLHFVYDLLPLMGGGAEQLRQLIEQAKPRVIFLDTLTALIKGGGKRESDVFRSQYAEVSTIRKIAEETKTAIIVVHHVRKGVSDGAIEAIAGTGGIAAAIDAVWYMKRKPEGEATLEVIGREIEDRTWALRFEPDPAFGWHVIGDDAAQLLNGERREVVALLNDEGALSPAEIAVNLGKSRPAIRMLLKRMKDDGQVKKQGSKYIPSLIVSYRVTEREKENEEQ